MTNIDATLHSRFQCKKKNTLKMKFVTILKRQCLAYNASMSKKINDDILIHESFNKIMV